jgi:hypothetical protein
MAKKYPGAFDANAEMAKWQALSDAVDKAMGGVDLNDDTEVEKALAVVKEYDAFRRDLLLKNPLMQFEQLLVRRAQNDGLVANWVSNCQRGKGGTAMHSGRSSRPMRQVRLTSLLITRTARLSAIFASTGMPNGHL